MGEPVTIPQPGADCLMLDVGHGSSNVVTLPVADGLRRGIVVDCGRRSAVPLAVLRRYVDFIDVLLISHNDKDHWGGAPDIISHYRKAIGKIVFLQDRPVERNRLYKFVKDQWDAGNLLSRPMRAERDGEPRVLHDDKANGIRLLLVYPDMLANEEAREGDVPNATSAVVLLAIGSRRILFPGDATMAEWRGIHELAGRQTIECDVVAVPHHGAALGTDAEHDWLYTQAVKAESAVISVGTVSFRVYGHPRQEVIAALRRAGSRVICTQITEQCCTNLESLRPGVLRPPIPAQSSSGRDVSSRGRSRNLACASSVVVQVLPDTVEIARVFDHQRAVDALVSSGACNPLCRRAL